MVDTGGDLYWCRHTGYKTGAKTWQNNGCNKIGWGWGGYSKLIGGSPDGVIYAISNDGVAYWHRHLGMLDGSQSWDPWGGHFVKLSMSSLFAFQRTFTPARPLG